MAELKVVTQRGELAEQVGGLVLGESSVDEGAIPEPLGYMVLVEPVRIEEQTAGGIALVAETVEKKQFLRNVGRIVKLGPGAFRGDEVLSHWGDLRAGDFVLHDAYNGFVFPVVDGDGRRAEYRMIKDNQIWGRVPDPQAMLRAV
jgi:co-chaperonin GroES (HSP10)